MPQTRFVLKKALEFGHAVVVVVNKIDRPSARPEFVVNSTFELFIELNATDEQVHVLICFFRVNVSLLPFSFILYQFNYSTASLPLPKKKKGKRLKHE